MTNKLNKNELHYCSEWLKHQQHRVMKVKEQLFKKNLHLQMLVYQVC